MAGGSLLSVRVTKMPTIETTRPIVASRTGKADARARAARSRRCRRRARAAWSVGDGHREAERHRGDDRGDVALVDVCAHAGDVADVVTDVVGDDARVTGVVLGDVRFDLADDVGADVGGLGVDAAADAREERDRGSAHRERVDDGAEACALSASPNDAA